MRSVSSELSEVRDVIVQETVVEEITIYVLKNELIWYLLGGACSTQGEKTTDDILSG
jgi:hypothetical protein